MNPKVCIATSRDVGQKCIDWARDAIPTGFTLVEDIDSADIIISVMYDKLIDKNTVSEKQCFNFHPGVLPEYRGAGAYSWVILNGERKTGVTLHRMDSGIDTGDIIEIREFLIRDDDTAYSLFKKAEKLIYRMFREWFSDILFGEYEHVPQKKNEGSLYLRKDLHKVKDVTQIMRAFHFPGKESAYYLNDSGDKVYLNFKGQL